MKTAISCYKEVLTKLMEEYESLEGQTRYYRHVENVIEDLERLEELRKLKKYRVKIEVVEVGYVEIMAKNKEEAIDKASVIDPDKLAYDGSECGWKAVEVKEV